MENKLSKMILSKICIDLINNFKSLENFEDEYIEEISRIEEENKKIISDNLKIFGNCGLGMEVEEFLEKNIEKIYADLFQSLIKNKKFENYEFIVNVMKRLDMENILITEKMYDELKDVLNKEEFVKDYKIKNKEDIYDENKINFYFIILKYILKSSFYIYNLNFFFETRKIIINLLKSNEVINKGKIISFNDKITYVIKKLVDSDYYFLKIEKLELVLEYYKELLFESKKEDIQLIEDILNNNKKFEDILLIDYEKAKKMKKKLPIIKFIFEGKYKDNKNKRTESEIIKVVATWEKLEKMISQQKIKKMKDDERRIICKYFTDNNNKDILLENFGQKIYDGFLIKLFGINRTKN